MTSPTEYPSLESPTQHQPMVNERSAEVSIADHHIDGIGQGSLSDLQFRPNASFHPIREVQFDRTQCTLLFDRPIKPINRTLHPKEVIALIEHIRRGERELAVGQKFYLYPSKLAFGLSQTGELRIVLRNIRPRHLHTNISQSQMSVIALLNLIESHCPKLWYSLSRDVHKIKTLTMLQEALHSSSALLKATRLLWRGLIYLIFLWLLSLPVAAFGPPQLRDPLRSYYHPFFHRLTELLTPDTQPIDTQVSPANLVPPPEPSPIVDPHSKGHHKTPVKEPLK